MANRAKAKGTRGEVEFVNILNEAGIPSMRVLGSGAMQGADSDIKVGLKLDDDEKSTLIEEKKFPPKDEARGTLRAEVKNRKTNPDYLHDGINGEMPTVTNLALLSKACPEYLYDYLNQDAVSSLVVLKRARTPNGALKNKDFNQTHMVCMGLNDFIKLFKKAHPDVVIANLGEILNG
jgi:hypothetical protein